MNGMASAIAATKGNDRVTTAAAHPYGVRTNPRPASQSMASSANGSPCGMYLFFQFCPAVKRNPTMTASVRPNNISWACQSEPSR
jgi:hypothetical protein